MVLKWLCGSFFCDLDTILEEFLNLIWLQTLQQANATRPRKSLKNKDKSWLQHSTDMAEWFYILESTRGNTKFMDSITYVYNKDNSTVHFNSWYHNKNSQERTDTINFIKSMKK